MADTQINTDEVTYHFNLAIEQAADINLFFLLDRCMVSLVKAPCVVVKNRHFVVRAGLSQLNEHPLVWGSEVRGYFTVRDANIVHCHFTSRLTRLYNGPLDSMYLIFPLPQSIDHNQRRFSRRVNMDRDTSSGFGIWHGVVQGGDFESLPQIRWEGLENDQCELGELSASGLRLDVQDKTPLCERMAVNDPILLKGDFGLANKSNPIFVLGKIVRKMPKAESDGIINMGCHFMSWRKVDARPAQPWFRADAQEGIGLISQWLSRNFRAIS